MVAPMLTCATPVSFRVSTPPPGRPDARESMATLSQWQLILRRFARHRIAVLSLHVLVLLYLLAIFAEFFAPYSPDYRDMRLMHAPPQAPHLNWKHGLHVYAMRQHVDPVTLQKYYTEDRTRVIPLGFFIKGEPYRLMGLLPWDCHFVGVNLRKLPPIEARAVAADAAPTTFFLLGADRYGHDVFSRILHGARISLSIGLVSIVITFLLGILIGGISGYLGGVTDNLIQRGIEIINAFPQLPLWLALGAAMPAEWSPLLVYFMINIVLSLFGWTGLARVVRGKILALREEDYAMAARLIGMSHGRVLFRHLLPGFTSHIIVTLTLTVPGMILGETALSFLGLGLRPPIVSWGVMLQDCMNIAVLATTPWLLAPVFFIILTVLAFNFLGDGLRDASDPYSTH
jgi:peptide/nickel transport system permease protein